VRINDDDITIFVCATRPRIAATFLYINTIGLAQLDLLALAAMRLDRPGKSYGCHHAHSTT